MIVYALLEVRMHGLNEPNHDVIVERARRALEAEFNPDHGDDIEVECIEHAGVETT